MIITGTNLIVGKLDISSLERIQEKNPIEAIPFRIAIKANQSIVADDKFYTLQNIQSALRAGLITIRDYDQQDVFVQEVETAESVTPNFNLTKVNILNRADFPQLEFEKMNANMDIIDANLGTGGGGGTTNHAALTHLDYASSGHTGFLPATHLSDFAHSDIAHANRTALDAVTNVNTGDQDLSAYDSHIGDTSIHFTEGSINHNNILNVGTNSHAQIDLDLQRLANTSGVNTGDQDLTTYDSHIGDASIHFTEGSINHNNISNIGTNSHAQIDLDLQRLANTSGVNTGDQDLTTINNHIGDAYIHFTEGSINHNNILNVGTNSHAQIDLDLQRLANTSGVNTGDQDLTTINNHIGDASIHFTEGSINHNNILNVGTNSHAQIDLDLQRLANTSGTNTGDQDLTGFLKLDQTSPQTFTGGTVTGSGLLNVTSGTLGLDTNSYLTSVTAHDLLSATHGDTLADTVVKGDILVGNDTPKWARLAGNTTVTKKYLQSVGDGAIANTPTFEQVAYADISGTPALSGYALLDGTNHPFTYVKTPKIYPASDSTTAFGIFKADGTTNIFNVDTTNGRVGIGTTPSTKLVVDGAHVSGLGLVRLSGATAATDAWLTMDSGAGKDAGFYLKNNGGTGVAQWYVYNAGANNSFKIDAGATNAVTISSNGRFGIGTATPGLTGYDVKLHTYGTGTGATGRTMSLVENNQSSAGAIFSAKNDTGVYTSFQTFGSVYQVGNALGLNGQGSFGSSSGLVIFSDADLASGGTNSISFRTGGYNAAQERIRITSAGDIGIGTATPVTLFEVRGSTGGLTLTRNTDVAAEEPFVRLRKGVTPLEIAQIRGISGGGLRFTNGASDVEWARFSSAGLFGVGQNVPTNCVHIKSTGGANSQGQLYIESNGNNANNTGFGIQDKHNNNALCSISATTTTATPGLLIRDYANTANGASIILERGTSSFYGATRNDLIISSVSSGNNILFATHNGTAAAERVRFSSNGTVDIGAGSLTSNATHAIGLDVSYGSIALVVGADTAAFTRTNTTNKEGRIGVAHYTNTEEPVAFLMSGSTSAASSISIGGGSSLLNAATQVSFYTAATTTTLTGTERMRIDSTGAITIADGGNFILNTTTGTKFATATSQKIGFWNATPIVQPVTDAYVSDSESVAYAGIDNAQAGSVYAQLSDLNQLRVAYDNLRASYDDLLTKIKTTGIVA